MPNNFCKYLSNQVRIEYGYMKPCCWFQDQFKVSIDDENEVKLFRKNLASISSWEDAGGACEECEIREKAGLHSPRLESLGLPAFAGDISADAIVTLEIQIDRDCNAACLICGPWNSSTWQKYNAKIQSRFSGIPIKEIPDTDIDTLVQIDKLKKILSLDQSADIRFLGGEPLRNDHHVNLLSEVTHPENITLNYTTNGSYRPDIKLLDFWKQFKRVNLTFSIDGVGEHFNYLRWPLQWHQVESNIQYLLELGQENIKLTGGSYTVTPFSLYYHDRYVEAYEQFVDRVGHPVKPWFDCPWEPRGKTPMSLSAVPPELAQVIAEKYGPDHSVTKLLIPFSPEKHKEFRQYIARHDYNRQTNWQETFPEMIPFYS
jgi:hypothetical protein